MFNQIIFDDTKGSGWCVAHTNSEGLADPHTIYAMHATCTRTRHTPNGVVKKDSGERWSWFMDDIDDDNGVQVCFECGQPVPEHIQALVVLQTPMEDWNND